MIVELVTEVVVDVARLVCAMLLDVFVVELLVVV
jgi:hypothetical protein